MQDLISCPATSQSSIVSIILSILPHRNDILQFPFFVNLRYDSLASSPPTEALDGGFPVNTSFDQLIARQIGKDTLLPSLELSCNDHTNQKETRYFENISWYGPGYAASVQKNPRDVFDQLFGKPDPRVRSVLDAVLADVAKAVK